MTQGPKIATDSPGRKNSLSIIIACTAIILGLASRMLLLDSESGDYHKFFGPWYDFINENGGFNALRNSFAHHSPPYLYLLTIATLLPIEKLYAIKLLSIIFDFVMAGSAYLVVRARYGTGFWATRAFAMILFIPTVVLNSAVWAQWDVMYTTWLILSIFFLIRRKPLWAMVFFAIGLSFKLQAVFFLPVLLVLALKKEIPWWSFILIPLVYFIAILPAVIIGRPMTELLLVYFEQKEYYMGLTHNCPNAWQMLGKMHYGGYWKLIVFLGALLVLIACFRSGKYLWKSLKTLDPGSRIAAIFLIFIPLVLMLRPFIDLFFMSIGKQTAYAAIMEWIPGAREWLVGNVNEVFGVYGFMMCGIAVLSFVYIAWRSRKRILVDPNLLIKLSLVGVLIMPFLLPRMHERFFYPADVISVLYGFYNPKKWFVPVVIVLVSFLSYFPFLRNMTIIPMPYLAMMLGMIFIYLVIDFIHHLDIPSTQINTSRQ